MLLLVLLVLLLLALLLLALLLVLVPLPRARLCGDESWDMLQDHERLESEAPAGFVA
jgi:hypothetical protein